MSVQKVWILSFFLGIYVRTFSNINQRHTYSLPAVPMLIIVFGLSITSIPIGSEHRLKKGRVIICGSSMCFLTWIMMKVVGSLGLSFLGIILRVLRLEVSVYTIKCLHYKPVSNHFSRGNCEEQVGLAMEFHSGKIPRNRLGMASVIPRKKVLIPRHFEVYGRVDSETRNGRKILLQQTE